MIHVAVDHGIVHRVGHCQPVDGQVDLLDVLGQVDVWVYVANDEVDVEGEPAHAEYQHDDDHHLDNLNLNY